MSCESSCVRQKTRSNNCSNRSNKTFISKSQLNGRAVHRRTAGMKLESIRPRSGSSGWRRSERRRRGHCVSARGTGEGGGVGQWGRRALRPVAAAEARAQQRARARRRRSTNGARCFADYRCGATPRHGQRHDRHYQARVSFW